MAAIADLDLDICVPLSCQPAPSLLSQLFNEFDAEHALRKLRQDRRLVAQLGADLQHGVTGTHVEKVGHHGDNERLRDRLAESDWQGRVGVGVRTKLDGTNSWRGTLAMTSSTLRLNAALPRSAHSKIA